MVHYIFFLLPEFSNLCLANAVEPLRAANHILGREAYSWSLASLEGEAVRSSSNFLFTPDLALDGIVGATPKADVMFILSSYNYRKYITKKLLTALGRFQQHIPVMGGLDTGAYALAKSELLEGYRATIHWEELTVFEEEFLGLDVVSDCYVIDQKRITAGGATTTLDLMLELIRRDYGRGVALGVANLFIYNGERQGGERQKSRIALKSLPTSAKVAAAISYMEDNIEMPHQISVIADHVGCSQRELERSFQKALQTTTVHYYVHVRLMTARNLLAETQLSLAEIAARTGFNSNSAFSQAYSRNFGETPSGYRRQRQKQL